jgi:hypothetical protein
MKIDIQAVVLGMDWIDLPPYRDRWRALVSAAMDTSSSVKRGQFLELLRTG